MCNPIISVVVCTYNRSDLLATTLRTLCEQALSKTKYEIIVVDNNSSDSTRFVVEEFIKKYEYVRYLFEAKQGLSHARNLGWREARGLYVAYTDDDCRLPFRWLESAKEVISTVSPGVFGGPYFPFYDSTKPKWFKDAYGSHEQGFKERPLNSGEFLDGMNIFFRRSLLEELGGFDTHYGMTGKVIAYGEETDVLLRIRSVMPLQIIYYEPRLHVYHMVRKEKMQPAWIMRQKFALGKYSYTLFEGTAAALTSLPDMFLKFLNITSNIMMDIMKGIAVRDRARYPYLQNYLYEHTAPFIERLGALYGQYRHFMTLRRRQPRQKKAI